MSLIGLARRWCMGRQLFWTGRRVAITGHTGFKGTWLAHLAGRARRRGDRHRPDAADRAFAVRRQRVAAAHRQPDRRRALPRAAGAASQRGPARDRVPSGGAAAGAGGAWPIRSAPSRATFWAWSTCSTPCASCRRCGRWSWSPATNATCGRNAAVPKAIRWAGTTPTAPARPAPRSSPRPTVTATSRPSAGIGVATARAGNVIGGGDFSRRATAARSGPRASAPASPPTCAIRAACGRGSMCWTRSPATCCWPSA